MANIPVKIQKFTDMEKDFGTTISPALWQKAGQLINYLDKSYPIGMMLFFEASQPGLPQLPDPTYWQLLDGSTVSNPNSPLDGVILPDFRNKMFRHVASGEFVLTQGGSDTIDLTHNHGGITGATSDRGDFEMDNGQERNDADTHAHTISNGSGTVSTLPAYHAVQVYIRIV